MRRWIAIFAVLLLLGPVLPVSAQNRVTCESEGHDHRYCKVDTSGGVTMEHQLSHAGCWKGDTWGFDQGGIWVSNGCRAEFVLGAGDSDWGTSADQGETADRDGSSAGAIVGGLLAAGAIAAIVSKSNRDKDKNYGRPNARLVTCQSFKGRYQYCNTGWAQHVELHRQLTNKPCRYNRDWGYDRTGIWVSNGCKAEFMLDGHSNDWGWGGGKRGVTLYSDFGFRGRSETFTRDINKLKGTTIRGNSARSVSLDRGCRARLYSDRDFRGPYIEVSGAIADLSRTRVGVDSVSSVRVSCK